MRRMATKYGAVFVLLFSFFHLSSPLCTDHYLGTSVYCSPPVMDDIAGSATITATSTCGSNGPETVCQLGSIHSCGVCDSGLSHPPSAMTDDHSDTFWRSQTYGSIPDDHDDGVNITLSLLGKAHYIEKISLVFVGPKPESFRILISNDNGTSFEPLRYFSQLCQDTYGISPSDPSHLGSTPQAPCVSEGTELTPLSGGPVTYTRPVESPRIIATDIMISLDNLNTLGSETTWNENSLSSYSYAISRLVVEGGCFCNGHADSCSIDHSNGALSCNCQHNTTGRDCQMCQPSHNDLEWQSLEEYGDSFSCKACDCNSRSNECIFNAQTYFSSGNKTGGVCVNCVSNTTGDHCELCAEGYYPTNEEDLSESLTCSECICDPRGVIGGDGTCETATQIYSSSGSQCPCKTNVVGTTCNQCSANHYNLMVNNTEGCQACDCSEDGSVSDICNELTGQCICKGGYYGRDCQPCECHSEGSADIGCNDDGQCQCRSGTVGGDKCDKCLSGFYSISKGCLDCGCSLHGSFSGSVCNDTTGQCDCRPGYSGRDCSICPEGFHNIDNGVGNCTKCPDCYDSISEDYRSVEALLMELLLQTNLTLQAVRYDTNLTMFVTVTEESLNHLLQLVRNLTQRELLLEMAVNETSVILDNKVTRLANFSNLVREAFKSSEMALKAANNTRIEVDSIFDLHEILRRELYKIQEDLTTAHQYLEGIALLRESLANIANESSMLSMEQTQTVKSLLLQSGILVDNTTNSLDIMCEAVTIENSTATELRDARNNTVTALDQLMILTNQSLQAALSNSSSVLTRSIAVYDSVLGIVIPDYNGNKLLMSARFLLTEAAKQRRGIDSLSNETKLLRNVYLLINTSVQDIVMRIEYLDSTVADLLNRSRVALSTANTSVASAEIVIQEVDSLLEEIQRRLEELQRFLVNYNSLVELVRMAENISSTALGSSTSQLQEVQRIANLTRNVDTLLQRTLTHLDTTMKVLNQANSTVIDTLRNVQSMNVTLQVIPGQLDTINSSVLSLEHRAVIDKKNIGDAEVISNMTKRNADSLEEELIELNDRLERLLNDINNVTLVSEARYLTFKSNVNSLESAINLMKEEIDSAANEISGLEAQSEVLEQKYSNIRRHLDLLRDIRANMQDLDCSSNVVE